MSRRAGAPQPPSGRADIERRTRQVVRTARAMDAALWSVCLLVAYFSAGNVFAFATDHDTPWYVALVLAPIVDVALFSVIAGDSVLGRLGIVLDSRWPKGLRLFAAGATWVLNVWQSTGWFAPQSMDVAGVVLHSIPPVVLIFLAESTPAYRAAFANALDRLRATSISEIQDTTAPISVQQPVASAPVQFNRTAPVDRSGPIAVQPPSAQRASASTPERSAVPEAAMPTAPDRTAAGSVEELLPIAREVAAELAASGRNLSRRALADGVRARGFTCSTDRAMSLLAALDKGQTSSDLGTYRLPAAMHAINGTTLGSAQ